jgi:phosphoribosylformylglycinamidine (FGAM) synthase-like enzyme
MSAGLVRACHDCSEGGLAVAAAEMCIAGRLGMSLELDVGEWIYFVETNSSFLVEVRPEDCAAFESCFPDLYGKLIVKSGFVTADARLEIRSADRPISLSVDRLVAAWQSIDSAADRR